MCVLYVERCQATPVCRLLETLTKLPSKAKRVPARLLHYLKEFRLTAVDKRGSRAAILVFALVQELQGPNSSVSWPRNSIVLFQ